MSAHPPNIASPPDGTWAQRKMDTYMDCVLRMAVAIKRTQDVNTMATAVAEGDRLVYYVNVRGIWNEQVTSERVGAYEAGLRGEADDHVHSPEEFWTHHMSLHKLVVSIGDTPVELQDLHDLDAATTDVVCDCKGYWCRGQCGAELWLRDHLGLVKLDELAAPLTHTIRKAKRPKHATSAMFVQPDSGDEAEPESGDDPQLPDDPLGSDSDRVWSEARVGAVAAFGVGGFVLHLGSRASYPTHTIPSRHTPSHLVSLHLISSHLIHPSIRPSIHPSSRLISSHLVSPHPLTPSHPIHLIPSHPARPANQL